MEQIRENCVLMSDSMGRGEAAQDTRTNKNKTKIDVAPAKVKRGNTDDVNQHHAAKKYNSG